MICIHCKSNAAIASVIIEDLRRFIRTVSSEHIHYDIISLLLQYFLSCKDLIPDIFKYISNFKPGGDIADWQGIRNLLIVCSEICKHDDATDDILHFFANCSRAGAAIDTT